MTNQRTGPRANFFMVHNAFWESGLAASLGHTSVMTLMALARHMDREQKCWPSQKRLARHLNVSAQTVNGYVKSLLTYRLLDGTPLVTATKRPTGRTGQSRLEYHLNPICQITRGSDPPPIDPQLVPPPAKRKGATPETLDKARKTAANRTA